MGEELVGVRLRSNSVVLRALETAAREVAELSSQITEVRPPLAALQESFSLQSTEAGDNRGRPLFFPYIGSGIGNGALVELMDGSVKWDMLTGIGAHFFGHSHPKLVRAALDAALEDTAKHGNLQSGSAAFAFTNTLLGYSRRNSRLTRCHLTTSGTTANENALRICFQKNAPAVRVIAFENCFLGRSIGMTSIGDSPLHRKGNPVVVEVDHMPFYTRSNVGRLGGESKFIAYACHRLETLVRRYPRQHACFVFELVQGEGGFNPGKREFFRALMKLCKANEIAVWDDEVQTFGRTTEMFAYDTYGVGEFIDVLSVGKITQACATLYTEEYRPQPGLLAGTFTGSTTDFAIGKGMVDMLAAGSFYGERGLIAQHHKVFCDEADSLVQKHPEWFPSVPGQDHVVDGIGGMMRLTPFGGVKEKVLDAVHGCFDHGVVLFSCGRQPYHLRLLPPLGVMKLEDWPRVFSCIEKGLARAYSQ